MLKSSHIYIIIAIISSALFSCGRQIPDDVIDSDKMENILYDYHLAKIMGDELPYDQAYKKELYIKYVFKKYKITSAQFDSSMVWYSKHADELAKIYVNIDKRYAKNSEDLKSTSANFVSKSKRSLNGDTLDIWNASSLFWLTSSELTNKMTFNIVADTSYRKSDMYIMEGDFRFLKSGKQSAVMALSITLDNDSVIGRTQEIRYSGPNKIYLAPSDLQNSIRSVNGFIYYKAENKLPGMIANNLSLIKIHRNLPPMLPADSTQAQKPETQNANEPLEETNLKRVSPEMLKVATDVDSINNNSDSQPVRNDPRSIRERSPKKLRPKVN